MNLESLLNRRPTLLESTTRLTSLVLKYNRQEIEAKSLLLKQRKETSKQRIKTFRNIQADANRRDNTNDLLSGGLATGGGLSLLRGKKTGNNIRPFRRPIKPGRLGGLSRISKGSVITNTLFAGLDFANRKSAGQTNLQAGLGAGGGAAGGIAGAAIGQALIPIPVLGALIGGFVGANIGSGLADRASGVTGGDFRRLQLERESIRQSGRTEFTDGLDKFDSALDKFRKYDDDLEAFILRATGNDKDQSFPRFIPRRGGGGATQAQIDSAYAKGVGVGVGSLVLGAAATILTIKGGALLLPLLKKKLLLQLVKGTFAKKILQKELQFGLKTLDRLPKAPIQFRKGGILKKKVITKPKPRITRSKTKPFSERKTLTNQNKVTYSDKLQRFQKYNVNRKKRFKRQLNNIIKSNKNDIKNQRKLIKKVEKEITAPKPNEVKDAKKVLDQFLKDNNLERIKTNVKQSDIQELIQRGKEGLSPDSPLFKLFNKKNLSDNTIIKEGDNFIAFNSSDSPTDMGGRNEDPYESSLNIIKAYSEQTA